jgi:hypothetical protein
LELNFANNIGMHRSKIGTAIANPLPRSPATSSWP